MYSRIASHDVLTRGFNAEDAPLVEAVRILASSVGITPKKTRAYVRALVVPVLSVVSVTLLMCLSCTFGACWRALGLVRVSVRAQWLWHVTLVLALPYNRVVPPHPSPSMTHCPCICMPQSGMNCQ